MTTASNNLVEAAAGAIHEVSRFGGAAELRGGLAERYAQAVLEAVGDALRLEGAQAERERWNHAISTVRAELHAAKMANPEVTIDEQEEILDSLLRALGDK